MLPTFNKRYLLISALLLVGGAAAIGYVGNNSSLAVEELVSSSDSVHSQNAPATLQSLSEISQEASPITDKRVLVKFTEKALAMDALAQEAALVDIGVTNIETFTYAGNISVLALNTPKSIEHVIAVIEASGLVEYAEPDYVVHTETSYSLPENEQSWGLHNTGETGGIKDADIDAPEAWEIFAKIPKSHPSNTPRPIIALLDTGIDLTHPSLMPHLWQNPASVSNSLNSRICDNDTAILPLDTHGHGTQVAGVIASLNPHNEFKLLPVKALCDNGRGHHSDIIASIDYLLALKQQGVNISVANLSFGGSDNGLSLLSALQALASQQVVIVASAGNDGRSNDEFPHYPANYAISQMIVVAASDNNDHLASNSNYGISTVDLVAPGVDIYTAQLGGDYSLSSGSSLSAAYISGTAAMAQVAFPSLSAVNIKSRIMSSVDKRNQFSGQMVSRGRLNASKIFDGYIEGRLATSQFSSVDRNQRIQHTTFDNLKNRSTTASLNRSAISGRELDIVANHIMMRFADTYKGYSLEERSALLEPFGVSIEKDFPYAGGVVLLSINGAPRAPIGKLPEGETKESVHERVNRVVEQLQESGLVEYAEPDSIVSAAAVPNDTLYDQLWGLEVIQAEQAVDHLNQINASSTEVVIAVIDSGIDYNHPDLVDNMWVNTGEIPGDGLDNDNNGHHDDIYGYNAINNTGDPMDDHSHGTHVAGTIGATRNNGLGVAGVSPNVRLMAVKFLNSENRGSSSDILASFDYVHMMKLEQGVNIRLTNNSWGGGGENQSVKAAIEASEQYGILFVAAAGNSKTNTDLFPQYPASYDVDNIISVAATNEFDVLASSFSNYGSSIDIAAPGDSILSTVLGGSYGFDSGTSMAAPHVSGVLGLMLSAKPDLSIGEAKSTLLDSADTLPLLDGLVNSSRRLNAYNAVFEEIVIDLSASAVTIEESGSVVVNVRLGAQPEVPGSLVTINIEKSSGDDSLVLSSSATLVFDDSNWNIWQPVTFTSMGDLDISNDSAAFRVSTLGAQARSVTVNEQDNGVLPDNICDAISQIPQDECNALVTFYESTDGANWTNNDGWLSTDMPCSWYGIVCSLDGHVSNIFLGFNNLQGDFPSVVSAFTRLQSLSLSSNSLSGSIPSSLSRLAELRYLWLSSNQLTGSIPSEIGDLLQLEELSLWGNQLSGIIPTTIGAMSSLRNLSLGSNQLTGDIPSEIGDLLQLEELSIWNNQLSGVIPNTIGGMSRLRNLSLSSNQLTGDIPEELFGLLELQTVYLHGNQLTGSIPEAIGNLSNLVTFDVGYNQISGSLPNSLSSLSNLEQLLADGNQLTGVISSNIGNASQLSTFLLDNNQLTGEIPESFYSLVNLTSISLSNNQLSGELSSSIANLVQLNSINISNNQLVGAIPTELGSLNNIYFLDLSNNQLTGAIPSSLGSLTGLSSLDLSYNQLSGAIPADIANLNGVFGLRLNNNQLAGSIPAELGNLSNLQYLSLQENALTGDIPASLGNLVNLGELHLQNNQLSGSIPAELGNLNNLWYFYLQENALTGSIPTELGNLSNLSRLYLYSNQLTGSIPSELSNLSTVYRIYLYDNQLTGSIPPELGAMNNASRFYFYDNQLSGEIPAELGSAPGLYRVLLQNNRLSGSIPPELGESATISRLLVSNNQLSGEVTEAIANLYMIEVSYNALEAENTTAANALDVKDPSWSTTQTLAPTNITASLSNGQTIISWTPISYTVDQGEYIISYSDSPVGPFVEHGRVTGKSNSAYVVVDAASYPDRFYIVQSRTLPHGAQQNDILSGVSAPVRFDNIVNPSITLPSALTLDAYSENGFEVVYPLIDQYLLSVIAVDRNGNPLMVSHNAPSVFLVGTTRVTFEACDSEGNCSSVTQDVTVDYDPVEPAPTVSAPANMIVEAQGDLTPITIGSATATDLVDGSLTVTPSEVGPFSLGTHQILWAATNSVGKTTVAMQNITVQDTVPPSIAVPADVVAMGRIDFDTGIAIAADLFDFTVESDKPDFFPFGVTTITWTATDVNGNTSTAEQTITVNPVYVNNSSQIACEVGEAGDTVWAIDPDNDTVSMISVSRNPITSERIVETKNNFFMFTDSKPSSITRVNNYVATTYADTGSIRFNQVDFPWFEGGTVPWTTWKISLRNEMPIASVAHNNMLYVALYASGEVIKIDTESREIVSRLKVGAKPKAMALTSDGTRLLVTRFISTADYGEVYDINTAGNMSFRDPLQPSIQINKVWVPDDIDHGSGVPNYLRSIVIDPDDQFAYVSANKANVDRGEYLNGQALSADNTVRSMIAILDLDLNRDTNIDSLTRDDTTDILNAADPSGLNFLPDGETGVYALQGNNRIELYDFDTESVASTVDVGHAPQSLCVTEDWLYVKNHTDRTVSVIDIESYLQSQSTTLSSEQIVMVDPEDDVLSETELQGLQLFYSASNSVLSPEGYMSCASCHDDGGHDGMTWDFTHMGEGLRNTLSLRGAGGARFGLLNWSGSADEVQDIEKQLEQLHGSNGFITGIDFSDQTPLLYASLGRAEELDALSDYVSSLGKNSVMKSPNYCEWGDNECWSTYYSGAWQYHSHGCKDCHARESRFSGAYRDGMIHDMDTTTEASGLSAGLPLSGIRTPTLIELWDTAPYLHDGSAEALEDVMNTGVHATYGLDEREMRNLIQFIKNIDRDQYIDDDELFNP
ncbi:S8 family serine peptidase [Eionea flava]